MGVHPGGGRTGWWAWTRLVLDEDVVVVEGCCAAGAARVAADLGGQGWAWQAGSGAFGGRAQGVQEDVLRMYVRRYQQQEER